MTTNPATPAPAEALDHDWIDRHAILSAQVTDNVTVLLASSVRRAVDDWITRRLATLAAQGTQAAEPSDEQIAEACLNIVFSDYESIRDYDLAIASAVLALKGTQ